MCDLIQDIQDEVIHRSQDFEFAQQEIRKQLEKDPLELDEFLEKTISYHFALWDLNFACEEDLELLMNCLSQLQEKVLINSYFEDFNKHFLDSVRFGKRSRKHLVDSLCVLCDAVDQSVLPEFFEKFESTLLEFSKEQGGKARSWMNAWLKDRLWVYFSEFGLESHLESRIQSICTDFSKHCYHAFLQGKLGSLQGVANLGPTVDFAWLEREWKALEKLLKERHPQECIALEKLHELCQVNQE